MKKKHYEDWLNDQSKFQADRQMKYETKKQKKNK